MTKENFKETDENVVSNGATTNQEAPIAKKKNRRGVSNDTRATTQLKFHEKEAAPGFNLFIGHLDEVKMDWRTLADDVKGLASMAGLSIPRLTFHFASNHSKVDERRHAYITLLPAESNVDTIPGGKEEWKVNNVFGWIKHLLSVYYLKGREMTEQEEDALALTFEDYDDDNNYVPVDVEDVIKGYQILFENVVAMFDGTFNLEEGAVAQPVYKTAKGTFIPCWMKLLRHQKRKNEWVNATPNGELGFPTFVGEGAIEIMGGANVAPSVLRVDLAKESITPKETKKAPTIGMVGVGVPGVGAMTPGMGMPSGLPSGLPTGGFEGGASFGAGVADDMPF